MQKTRLLFAEIIFSYAADIQLSPCTGHGYVEKTALLLDLCSGCGLFVGEEPLLHADHKDGIIFEPLGGVGGLKDDPAAGAFFHLLLLFLLLIKSFGLPICNTFPII